jgi:hypothetical protein
MGSAIMTALLLRFLRDESGRGLDEAVLVHRRRARDYPQCERDRNQAGGCSRNWPARCSKAASFHSSSQPIHRLSTHVIPGRHFVAPRNDEEGGLRCGLR